ncbi:MAG: L,D-transpeptidase [Anaerolineae bacterium]
MRVVTVIMAAVVAALVLVGQTASAQTTDRGTLRNAVVSAPGKDPKSILSLTYAWVITANVPVFANPADEAAGVAPVRSLGAGFLYVSLASTTTVISGDQKYYQINANEYVNAKNLAVIRPTSFQGTPLTATPDKPFGWMVYSAKPTMTAGGAMAGDAKTIARYTPITVLEEQKVDDLTWYRIGDSQWVDQKKVALIFPHARPDGVGPNDKWIDVNTFEQTLAAYEGDRMVYATLVSSGLPQWSTDPGLFRVYAKVKMAKMSGREGLADYYFLEDVPYATYFNKDMALHAAYWHDKFGFKHSHGCVNLPPLDAEWIYNWTTPAPDGSNWTVVPDRKNNDIGTWVWVHEG